MKIEYLYRGVSKEFFTQNKGDLKPKKTGERFSSNFQFGSIHAQFSEDLQFGDSEFNEVVKHQWDQLGIPTSGISTTPYFERAKFYALSYSKDSIGFVYKISILKLIKNNIKIFRVNEILKNPSIIEDDEHIIVESNYDIMPKDVILEVIEVRD